MPRCHWLTFLAAVFAFAVLPWDAGASVPPETGAVTRTRKPPLDLADVYQQLRENGCVNFYGLEISVASVEGRKLVGAIFREVGDKGRDGPVLRAKQAEFGVNKDNHFLVLKMCEAQYIGTDGTQAWFADTIRILPLPTRQKITVPPWFHDLMKGPNVAALEALLAHISDNKPCRP